MKFAVFSQDEAQRQTAAGLLRRRVAALCADITVAELGEPGELAALSRDGDWAMLLMDVDMTGARGLQETTALRLASPDLPMILFSRDASQALRSFPLHPLDYLLKPLRYETLADTLDWCRASWQPALRRLELRVHRTPVRVALSDLLYAESAGRAMRFYGRQGTLETVLTMTELEERLEGEPFLRCHKSFCVNLFAVREPEPEGFRLIDGAVVPVSRNRRESLLRQYTEFRENWLEIK